MKRFDTNFEKLDCLTTNEGFPILEPIQIECSDFIGFNFAKTCEKPGHYGVHFFIDDYQFLRVWNDPLRYALFLSKFCCVTTPDFSLYTDMPEILQKYNHYRRQWIGAYFQQIGIPVIPTVSWSDDRSFAWCFSGIPKNSTIAISSVGTQKNERNRQLFLNGYNEMLRYLKPTKILFYGKIPDACTGEIVRIKSFQENIRERMKSKWVEEDPAAE